MNLLEEAWLPVRLHSGERQWIRPSALARPEVAAFDASRADFNGALAQFGIALLQTVAAPGSKAAWKARWSSPPDEATLQGWLAPWADAFALDGHGPRFMQDLTLRAEDGEALSIANLLIETPGENTQKNNTDHFIKRGTVEALCPHCAALALFTLQTNAPSGGAGHRTGLRGGGPLTTLLVAPSTPETPRSLWHQLWLNVLPTPTFEAATTNDASLDAPHQRLPWLASLETTQGPTGETAPIQTHPLQVYWAMPRRIRLDLEALARGTCDVCHRTEMPLVRHYVTRNYGMNYKGAWRHPLSPYYMAKDEKLPMHPQPGGLGYRHWLGLVLGMHSDKRRIEAASVVGEFLSRPERGQLSASSGSSAAHPQLWAFGFDMDNMKARCWYETHLPLYDLEGSPTEAQTLLRNDVARWLAAADLAASYLRGAVKDAWFSDEARGDFSHIDAAFWQRTERGFYRLLQQRMAQLRQGAPGDERAVSTHWLGQLQAEVLRLFEHDFVGAGAIERQKPRRVAEARVQLRKNLHGPKLRAALELPALEKSASVAKPGSGRKKATAGA